MDEEHKIYLYSLCVPINSPQMRKSFFSALFKIVYPISVPMQEKPAQGNLAKHKNNHAAKFSGEF